MRLGNDMFSDGAQETHKQMDISSIMTGCPEALCSGVVFKHRINIFYMRQVIMARASHSLIAYSSKHYVSYVLRATRVVLVATWKKVNNRFSALKGRIPSTRSAIHVIGIVTRET